MYSLLKKCLFSLPPELAHSISLNALKIAHLLKVTSLIKFNYQPIKLMGLNFPNKLGLAAGLDKNGDYIDSLAHLGFGFIEIGTVTPQPQSGNAKPRLFRLTQEEAIINRMGFNNKGVTYLIKRLQTTSYKGIIGVNIGKNRATMLEEAATDYGLAFNAVAPFASYVTINISSPNTPELRKLQHSDYLINLLQELKKLQAAQKRYVPLVLKLSPDLSDSELQQIATILVSENIDGVIATNTTTGRCGVENSIYANESGGLSGKPLKNRSTLIIKKLRQYLGPEFPIIGCGGVFTAQDAQEKLTAGANLIQIYTGLIYKGFMLPSQLAKEL